jgi:hypothetical protein
MNRRKFLTITATGGLVVAISGGAIAWVSIEPSDAPLTTASVLEMIDKLADQNISHTGAWRPYKVFMHCAQSVDYSIDGYPEHKSPVFKNTIGKLAFTLFTLKRKMSHNLSEAIPGAAAIDADGSHLYALSILKSSLIRFKQFNGQLQAHFAYGELNKSEYELAHAMHFVNHLQEIALYNNVIDDLGLDAP